MPTGPRQRLLLPAVLLAFVVSILICVSAANRHSSVVMGLAVALFSAQVLMSALRVNLPLWNGATLSSAGRTWGWNNSLLAITAYSWGAAAMFSIYGLSDLNWRHWWQYGAAMALLAVIAYGCAHVLLGRDDKQPTLPALQTLAGMTLMQGIAAIAGLAYLVGTGALDTIKDDWAANHVFLAGGITIALLSLFSWLTYRRLLRQAAA
ncbi:hypothetical protein [Hyphomicrobium sp. D-2]|uniref:hypothetical protein n=1 Tax=Hyphomicrobium sp. D-2 TaxID=3041621 RepID=UPI0024573555|nr:hypothetical protein [Hyphomicrobium sp. D-2]MDH4983200.1 hypothetical protein [Hyphomicrobium sp. D-2]